MLQDNIADLLTRIRNAQMAGKQSVSIYSSNFKVSVVSILKQEGYIADFSIVSLDDKPSLSIELKYYNDKPVIRKIERISRPGLRIYASVDEIDNMTSGIGILILSTSKGVITDHTAKSLGIGGEVVCRVE